MEVLRMASDIIIEQQLSASIACSLGGELPKTNPADFT
jgi:hypothetical protein